MYAVVKKQEMVVHEGTNPRVEKLDKMDDYLRDELARHGVVIND